MNITICAFNNAGDNIHFPSINIELELTLSLVVLKFVFWMALETMSTPLYYLFYGVVDVTIMMLSIAIEMMLETISTPP